MRISGRRHPPAGAAGGGDLGLLQQGGQGQECASTLYLRPSTSGQLPSSGPIANLPSLARSRSHPGPLHLFRVARHRGRFFPQDAHLCLVQAQARTPARPRAAGDGPLIGRPPGQQRTRRGSDPSPSSFLPHIATRIRLVHRTRGFSPRHDASNAFAATNDWDQAPEGRPVPGVHIRRPEAAYQPN